jgi:pyruvate,orthophosphate dikinase
VGAGGDPVVEIMVPLVVAGSEFEAVAAAIRAEADAVAAESGVTVGYSIGSMVETPRAALVAAEVAAEAEFFSFGTNDLTQLTYGLSRDDVESRLLPHYLRENLIPHNPFQTIDRDGVGALLARAIADGRRARPDLKVGICGEHGGDPRSVLLCEELGLDYVSCSPYRVPIARLAAAQAVLALAAAPPVP